jgi:hypothetical protein
MSGWILGLLAVLVALYPLHRLAVRLERAGWIRYRNAAPDGSAGSGAIFAELQRIYEPSVRHVYELKEEHRPRREADGGDPNDPRPAQHPSVPPGEESAGRVS